MRVGGNCRGRSTCLWSVDSDLRLDYPLAMRATSYLFFGILTVAALGLAGCGPTYPKCDTDSHCADKGEVCVEGQCQQCRDNSNCGADQVCQGGRCVAKAECARDGDCSDNKICRSGRCQIECQASADCGSGLKCMGNRCVDELACASTSDCGAGLSCVNGRCSQTQISRGLCDFPTVQFAFDKATLTLEVRQGLEQVADCLQLGGTIVIEGHCDERGTEEYNLALGDRRARAVKSYLSSLGVPSSKLRVVSKGETEPLDNRSTESAWAKNRRAEFITP